MTEFNTEELARKGFANYERVRNLVMSSGEDKFSDPATIQKIQIVEDGGQLSPEDQKLLIQKCWMIKCALRAMDHLDNNEPPIKVPKVETPTVNLKKMDDAELAQLISEEPESLLRAQMQEEQNDREVKSVPTRESMVLINYLKGDDGSKPLVTQAITDELIKRREHPQLYKDLHGAASSCGVEAAGAAASASAAELTRAPELEALRSRSVKKGEKKTFILDIHLPDNFDYRALKRTINAEYPNCTFQLIGPKEVTIDGKEMLKYTVGITMEIINYGRMTQDHLQREIFNQTIEASGEDSVPSRMLQQH